MECVTRRPALRAPSGATSRSASPSSWSRERGWGEIANETPRPVYWGIPPVRSEEFRHLKKPAISVYWGIPGHTDWEYSQSGCPGIPQLRDMLGFLRVVLGRRDSACWSAQKSAGNLSGSRALGENDGEKGPECHGDVMYFNPKTSVKRRMYYSLALKRGFRATVVQNRMASRLIFMCFHGLAYRSAPCFEDGYPVQC